MKKLSWLLVIIMIFSCIGGAFAEGTEESSGAPIGANQVMDVRAEGQDQEAAAADPAVARIARPTEYARMTGSKSNCIGGSRYCIPHS